MERKAQELCDDTRRQYEILMARQETQFERQLQVLQRQLKDIAGTSISLVEHKQIVGELARAHEREIRELARCHDEELTRRRTQWKQQAEEHVWQIQSDWQQEKDFLLDKITQLEAERGDALQQWKQAEEETLETRKHLETAVQRYTLAEQKLQTAAQHILGLKTQLNRVEKKNEKRRLEKQQQKDAEAAVRAELDVSRSQNGELLKRVAVLERDGEHARLALQERSEQVASLQSALRERDSSIADTQRLLAEMTAKEHMLRDFFSAERERAAVERQELQAAVANALRSAEAAREQASKAEQDRVRSSALAEALETRLQSATAAHDRERALLGERLAALEKKYAQSRRHLKDALAANAELRDEERMTHLLMSVIGVDFGNVDCVIGQAKRGGIDIILNENSNRKNPNMVCIQGKQRFIGEAAVSVARMHFRNTATDIKRLIGRKFKHPEVQKEIAQLAYKCVELPNGDVGIVLNYNDEQVTFTCEQIVAMIFNKMMAIAAAANEGVRPAYAVLSCPGFYTDVQRRALLNASKIAGLNCLRLLNEHTAIALAYGIYKSARNLFHESEPQHVMFIDMGHASYTVSVVAFVQGKLQVKSATFDRFLGGRDFDYALAKEVAQEFQGKHKIDPLAEPKSRIKLLSACEKAKKNLSPHGVTATYVNIECLADEKDYSGQITLERFEELVAPLLDRLEDPIQRALKDAGIDKSQLASVEIVGGATRVSSVKRRLADILGLDKDAQNYGLSTTLNADESVARGCALQCAILSPVFKVKEFHIADKVHLPVRVSWEDGAATPMDTTDDNDEDVNMEAAAGGENTLVIFDRKDDYPKTKRITFRRDKSFSIDAVYDETAKAYLPPDYTMALGKYTISGIPACTETPRIRVNVQQDINGIFSVASSQLMQEVKEEETPAEEAKEGEAKEKEAEDKPAEPKKKRFRKVELKVEAQVAGMTTSEISAATEQELQMAHQDRVIEETFNKRNELESFVYDLRNQLTDRLAGFVSESEKASTEDKLTEIEDWLYSDEGFDSTKSVYQAKLDELRKFSSPIEFRLTESTERAVATSELQSVLEEYKRMANSTEEAYAHWSQEDRETLRKAAADAEAWLFDELAKQANLKPTDTPVLTSAAIRSKAVAVRAVALPIVTKPKPAPKVEAPAAPEAKGEEKEDAKEADKMDLD
ncbi:hypothetical protein ATCC90586_002330 [Pythium insidiosum]|nr:hypothetical protein ATCC90586_002330 [Pythium insidiosum]